MELLSKRPRIKAKGKKCLHEVTTEIRTFYNLVTVGVYHSNNVVPQGYILSPPSRKAMQLPVQYLS